MRSKAKIVCRVRCVTTGKLSCSQDPIPNPPPVLTTDLSVSSLWRRQSNRRVPHHVSTGLRLAVWSTAGERGRHPATAGTRLAPGKPLIPPGHERDIRPPTYRLPTTQSDHGPRFASTQEKAPALKEEPPAGVQIETTRF